MAYRSILLPFSGHKEQHAAVDAACVLAKHYAAELTLLHISPDPRAAIAAAYVGSGVLAASFEAMITEATTSNNTIKDAAEHFCMERARHYGLHLAKNTIKEAAMVFCHEVGENEDVLPSYGRLADVIIIGSAISDAGAAYADIIASSIFNTGKPTLLIPPTYTYVDHKKCMAIAWNGSLQAARAITYALPLLKHAGKDVIILVEDDMPNRDMEVHHLMHYLQQHDIQSRVILLNREGKNLGESVIKSIQEHAIELLVMGAFTHNRFQQLVLGGLTNFMLEHAAIPVFMAH